LGFYRWIGVHNWLLGPLTAACIKAEQPQVAIRAIELAETRLLKDNWPEYYDGKLGQDIGQQTRKFQTWSIASYLVAKTMLGDSSHLGMISLEEDMIKAQFPEFFLGDKEDDRGEG
jgi:glycogen debranching enzyme